MTSNPGVPNEPPFPKHVFLIIMNEFCERFSYYGVKVVLTLYLKNVLQQTENASTLIYHVFCTACYFTPVFGGLMADSWLGRYKTILYLSLVYIVGNVTLSLGAMLPLLLPQAEMTMLGLLLISIGMGGIKPCVAAFGGDQFLPEQEKQLSSFFSMFYFSINTGTLLTMVISPLFRKNVQCFNTDTCYPLSFGVPAILMIISLIFLVAGNSRYCMQKPEGNILKEVVSCVYVAIRGKLGSQETKAHWLEHAQDKYSKEFIDSVKQLFRILLIYIPIPIFWALYDQQGSRWTFQATRLNGELFGYTIKPDQVQLLNPFLMLPLIAIFYKIIYPLLGKLTLLQKPLDRMIVGCVLGGCAFVAAGILELQLEKNMVKLGHDESYINFANVLPCALTVQLNTTEKFVGPFEQAMFKNIKVANYTVKLTPKNPLCKNLKLQSFNIQLENEVRSYIITTSIDGSGLLLRANHTDQLEKDGEGSPLIRLAFLDFAEDVRQNGEIKVKANYNSSKSVKMWKMSNVSSIDPFTATLSIPVSQLDTETYKLDPLKYVLELIMHENSTNGQSRTSLMLGEVHLKQGGNYLYVISNSTKVQVHEYEITPPNSIHMVWIIPQYLLITTGEVMLSITGCEFSFSEAPANMKSLLQALWLLNVAFGNMIVVFVTNFQMFDKQSMEFFLFAGIMFFDVILFAYLARIYTLTCSTVKKSDTNKINMIVLNTENGAQQME